MTSGSEFTVNNPRRAPRKRENKRTDREKQAVVAPEDAATVILLRRQVQGLMEVLMVLRHPNNKFVANFYVYPGGRIDDGDYRSGWEPLCRGMDHASAARILDDMRPPGKALGAWIAGIRETFEEVGLLMAYDEKGQLVSFATAGQKEKFNAYRKALCQEAVDFREILEREGLILAADRLHYFSHWVTPELLPIRYDVRFFVAQAPDRQEARHDGLELVEHVWINPREALQRYERGEFGMVLPTLMTMSELAQFATVDEVIRSTKEKEIPRILTRMEKKGNDFVEIMPDGTQFGPSPV